MVGIFGDPQLNALEEQVAARNQDLKVAEARFRAGPRDDPLQSSRAVPHDLRPARASRPSAIRPTGRTLAIRTSRPPATSSCPSIFPTKWTSGAASAGPWQRRAKKRRLPPPIWPPLRLSIQAELAFDYFELRSADAQQQLLDDTVEAYAEALQLTKNRFEGGAAPQIRCRAGADPTRSHARAGHRHRRRSARSSNTPSRC